MRICHLISRPEGRGAQLFALRLSEGLEQLGWDNRILAMSRSPHWARSTSIWEGRHVSVLSQDGPVSGFSGARWFKRAKELRNTVRDFRPDLVIAHGSTTLWYGAALRVLGVSSKVIYVNIGMASDWARAAKQRIANRVCLSRVDAVVSLTEGMREDFANTYRFDKRRIHVIPNGIVSNGSKNVRSAKSVEAGLKTTHGGEFELLSVGGLTPEKNHIELVEIFARVRERGIPARLTILGEGPERERLVSEAKQLGVDQYFRLPGWQPAAEAMTGADLFVMTSKTEGMPAVVIEAGFAGVPTVAYQVGGLSETVVDGVTGRLVKFGDQARFVDAIAELSANPDRRIAVGNRARAEYVARFDMDVVTRCYAELATRLVSGTTPG